MRVAGAYPSVVLGISEQTPHDRRPGQHTEQVNFISDPVRGLARRHGSLLIDSVDVGASSDQLSADLGNYGEYTFFVAGVEYSLLYRRQTAVSTAPALLVLNKDTGAFLPVVRPVTDATLDKLYAGGVSAQVNVGKYLFLAGNTITPTYSETARVTADSNNKRHVVWVRGGAYSRAFTLQLTMADGSTKVASYTTMASSYPTILDTSDIPFSDPEYTKKVSVRTNDYNSRVTKWIGDAAADIQPQSIAANLVAALAAVGVTATASGSHIAIDAAQDVLGVAALDGGDGQLVRSVSNEIKAAEEVSLLHFPGKVVKVRPKTAAEDDAYYLEAIPKVSGITTLTEVTWRECAGVQQTPTAVFCVATIRAGTFYVAGSPTQLQTLTGDSTPQFLPNRVGDATSAPIPYFFGKRITCMFTFQDRLAICADATTFMSKPGDYFNWFRDSVLQVADTDPIEIFAKGSEDDTLRAATTYDRNTIIFGDRAQYALNGRQLMTPKVASISVLASVENAVSAPPVSSGNYVFFGKSRDNVSSLHQLQIGQLAESPESYEVSKPLDRYLRGAPVQIVALTAPNMVFMRTTGLADGLYVYHYMDTPAGTERVFDAWARWQWASVLGRVVGIAPHNGDLLVYTVRNAGGRAYVVADRFVTATVVADRPYFDSAYPYLQAPAAGKWPGDPTASVAFGATSQYRFIGQAANAKQSMAAQYPNDLADLWRGTDNVAEVIPTNPYIRDREGKALLMGRLTLTRAVATVISTGGLTAHVRRSIPGDPWLQVVDFVGRILNNPTNLVGRQPVVDADISIPIMREATECQYKITSKRWLPLTITTIEWVGQSFNNARRV